MAENRERKSCSDAVDLSKFAKPFLNSSWNIRCNQSNKDKDPRLLEEVGDLNFPINQIGLLYNRFFGLLGGIIEINSKAKIKTR
jgi:hypothetical protein